MIYRQQFEFIHIIRQFFQRQNFLEIFPPPLVENPGMETHVHPLQVYSPKDKKLLPFYLHTSPEFFMKGVLAAGEERIFSLAPVFRDDPQSPIHRKNFLMLEWYRARARYELLMKDIEELIRTLVEHLEQSQWPIVSVFQNAQAERRTVDSLFIQYAGFSILDFTDSTLELKKKIQADLPQLHVGDQEWKWDDLFFIVFLNLIEPQFKQIPFLIVDQYPAPLAALSTLSTRDPRVAERFELYLNGLEVANCYNELIDFREQEDRFYRENAQKDQIYGHCLPYPSEFMKALKKGIPPSAGAALGVERLALALSKISLFQGCY